MWTQKYRMARAAWALPVLLLAACADEEHGAQRDAGGQPDAGPEADAEPAADAATDVDAGSEADAGAAADSGADVDSGAAPDAAPDVGSAADTGPADAGGAADAGPDAGGDPWQDCPSSAAYVGPDAGPHEIAATDAAIYCAMFDETRTLKEELAAKAQLRFAPGRYFLQPQNMASFALPICMRRAAPPHPAHGNPGSLEHSSSSFESTTSHNYQWRQPVQVGGSTLHLDARFTLTQTGATPPGPFALDGAHPPLTDIGVALGLLLCEDPENCWPATIFDSCHFEGNHASVHDVVLDQGTVRLELNIGDSFASTEPGAFVRASGTFRGQSFDQRDYWKLIYNPEHHHFVRDFAVLFDAPIDGVCGLEIAGLEPGEESFTPDQAFAVNCQLDRQETLTVTSHTHTRPGQ